MNKNLLAMLCLLVSQNVFAQDAKPGVGSNPVLEERLRGVMAKTRAQAANIAGRNAIREFHAGPGARYTHFHPANRNGSHVWYGRPR